MSKAAIQFVVGSGPYGAADTGEPVMWLVVTTLILRSGAIGYAVVMAFLAAIVAGTI